MRRAILAINKTDVVDFAKARFDALCEALEADCAASGLAVFAAAHLAARDGDNVATRSPRSPWHEGPPLLEAMETVDVENAARDAAFRVPVQLVIKPHPLIGGRGYAGTVAAGRVRCGYAVSLAHARGAARVDRILTVDGAQDEAVAGEAVIITLRGEHDIAHGDLLVCPQLQPSVATQIDAHLIILDERGVRLDQRYALRCATKTWGRGCWRSRTRLLLDGDPQSEQDHLPLNAIAICALQLSRPIPIDRFEDHRETGGFLLVDRASGAMVAAGTTIAPLDTNVRTHRRAITAKARRELLGHGAAALCFTGQSGAGKSTIADLVELQLHAAGVRTYALDGDNLRGGLNRDLGISAEHRELEHSAGF